MITATEDDAIYINILAKHEEDLDDLYSLASLKECVFDEDDKALLESVNPELAAQLALLPNAARAPIKQLLADMRAKGMTPAEAAEIVANEDPPEAGPSKSGGKLNLRNPAKGDGKKE